MTLIPKLALLNYLIKPRGNHFFNHICIAALIQIWLCILWINCLAVDCGSLGSPANGSINISTTTFASVAHYSCNLGYLLVGVESRRCQANRTWSGEEPICDGIIHLSSIIINRPFLTHNRVQLLKVPSYNIYIYSLTLMP